MKEEVILDASEIQGRRSQVARRAFLSAVRVSGTETYPGTTQQKPRHILSL
jgi:hypothetical protein